MDVPALIDRYCEAWTEPEPARRADLLRSVWAEDATYTDPSVHAAGASALLAHIGEVQARRPGAKVFRTSAVDAHHGVVRFAWHVVQADGTALPEGLDIAFLTADGAKLDRVIGFFGPLGPIGGSRA
jgi:SnoaL-like domain